MSEKWAQFQQRAKIGWHTFLFMPARYWKHALIVFTAILIIILLTDGWIFWQFGYDPHYVSDNPEPRHALNRKGLESALTLLRERETASRQNTATTSTRELFGLPPAPITPAQ